METEPKIGWRPASRIRATASDLLVPSQAAALYSTTKIRAQGILVVQKDRQSDSSAILESATTTPERATRTSETRIVPVANGTQGIVNKSRTQRIERPG